MEETTWRECQPTLSGDNPPPLRTLSAVRSLITNPSTSAATLSSILQTLTTSLSLPHPNHHHTLSLLSALSLSRPHLSPLISPSALSLFSSASSPRLATAALSLLLSIPESSLDSIDDGNLIALIFRPCVQSRMWMLENAARLRISAILAVSVFVGFTKDPYPGVRRAALDGLARVSEGGDSGIIEGCLVRGIELLGDAEDYVRAAAIRVVSRWGHLLIETKNESAYTDCSDFLFIQLCSMVRDMSVAVRLEAFNAIGSIKVVSENALLLTLSKRIAKGTNNEKKTLSLSSGKQYELPAFTVAGAFLHGLEDEFSEVRFASCKSLKTLTTISSKFSNEAANLVMDVMNDESMMVRLQALETIHHMTLCNHLKLQKEHMHVLVATISDKSTQIRSGAMEVLGLKQLPNTKLYIESLLANLNLHPQDEAKTLRALFKSGQVHSKFAFCVIEKAYCEMTNSGGKLAFDRPEMIGLVVLALSVSLSVQAPFHHILQQIISVAGVFLGRISYALREVMDQETLLAYLSQSGRSSLLSMLEDEDPLLNHTSGIDVDNSSISPASSVDSLPMETDDCLSEMLLEFREGTVTFTNNQNEMLAEVTESIKLILATTKSAWQLAKSGCTSEALKVLRCCQEEMVTIGAGTAQFASVLAFGLHYVRVVKLLTEVWDHVVMFPAKHFCGTGCLDLLLNKLEKHIMHLRYRFTGFSNEDELHILEFVLLNYVLRLYRVQMCSKTSKKLSTTMSHLVNLCQTVSVMPSEFVSGLVELSSGNCGMGSGLIQGPLLKNLLNLFDLKDIALSESIKHIKADMEFPGFDIEQYFPFISGLPVGVPCEITLYNISSENRLWLDMKVDGGLSQFLFLDLDQFGGYFEVTKFVLNAPLYRTPNATAFAMTLSIGMECFYEDLQLPKGHVGPRRPLVYLCEEKEIELFMVDNFLLHL